MLGKSGKIRFHEGFSQISLYIQVNLFFAEGAPEFLFLTTGEGNRLIGVLWLSLVDLLDLFLRGFSSPKGLVVNEVVLARRVRAFGEILLQ